MAASRRMLPVVSLNYIATLYASFNQVIAINEKSVDQRVIKMELIKILQTDIILFFFLFFYPSSVPISKQSVISETKN